MLKALCNKLHHLKHGQEGFALALTLLIWPLIWLMVAGVYVTGETIRQKIILQTAVDAAASAGAAVQADTLGRIDTLNRALDIHSGKQDGNGSYRPQLGKPQPANHEQCFCPAAGA